MELVGKNILITGGSKGIGFAIATQLAENGANVFLVARNKKALIQAKQSILERTPNIKCHVYSADVTSIPAVRSAVKEMKKKLGSIDGLINNAGRAYPQYFTDAKVKDFEEMMAVDYFGAVYFTKEVYPELKTGSFIAFVSSVVGYLGTFGYTSYAGPKFALIGFAESPWQESKGKGIQVSVLCPPDTQTPGYAEENKTKPAETMALSESAKLLSPEEVAHGFIKGLLKGKFLINVNFESAFIYRMHNIFPSFVRWMMMRMINQSQRKMSKNTKKIVKGKAMKK